MFERKEYEDEGQPVRPESSLIENYSVVRRQYLRAREYCGYSLDDLINSRAAQRYLSEIWLLGCMVRTPRKAKVLPEKMRIDSVVPVVHSTANATGNRPRSGESSTSEANAQQKGRA